MEHTHIRSITLNEIVNYVKQQNTETLQSIYQGCLVSKYSKTEKIENHLFDYPSRIDAIVFVICTKGSFDFSCNLKEYHIEAGTLLLLPPRSLISRTALSDDHEGYVVIFDTTYLGECNFNLKRFTSLMMEITDNNIAVALTENEASRLIRTTSTLQALIQEKITSIFRDDVIRSMVETLMYQYCEIFAMRISERKETVKINRQESYFRQFIAELSEHYTERQSVTYYAEKLCISSRYLTTIVRKISGLSVTDWMNKYILMEAKYLLKYSDMSIQEIAYRLSFPDQSFFGKYFKQHIGMSPSAYRAKQ